MHTPIGINPTVDFAFKLMFGSPEHSRVLIHFLNAVLGEPRITQVQILNPHLGREFEEDKLSILDILATDEHGRTMNIEMQTSVPAGLSQRLVCYVSNMYASQLCDGSPYSDLRAAISICVLTKPMFADIDRLHLDFRLRDTAGRMLTDNVQIHLLQLSKLHLASDNLGSATPLERWAYF